MITWSFPSSKTRANPHRKGYVWIRRECVVDGGKFFINKMYVNLMYALVPCLTFPLFSTACY